MAHGIGANYFRTFGQKYIQMRIICAVTAFLFHNFNNNLTITGSCYVGTEIAISVNPRQKQEERKCDVFPLVS
jgi:hypothetical protein